MFGIGIRSNPLNVNIEVIFKYHRLLAYFGINLSLTCFMSKVIEFLDKITSVALNHSYVIKMYLTKIS